MTCKELTQLSETLLALTDVGNAAYIKRVPRDKGTGYVLCTANGKQVGVFASHAAAFFTARQHDLEPVSLH